MPEQRPPLTREWIRDDDIIRVGSDAMRFANYVVINGVAFRMDIGLKRVGVHTWRDADHAPVKLAHLKDACRKFVTEQIVDQIEAAIKGRCKTIKVCVPPVGERLTDEEAAIVPPALRGIARERMAGEQEGE